MLPPPYCSGTRCNPPEKMAAANHTSLSGLALVSSAEAAATACGSLKGSTGMGRVARSGGGLLQEVGSGIWKQRSDWRRKQLHKAWSVELECPSEASLFLDAGSSSSSLELPETLLLYCLPGPRSSPASPVASNPQLLCRTSGAAAGREPCGHRPCCREEDEAVPSLEVRGCRCSAAVGRPGSRQGGGGSSRPGSGACRDMVDRPSLGPCRVWRCVRVREGWLPAYLTDRPELSTVGPGDGHSGCRYGVSLPGSPAEPCCAAAAPSRGGALCVVPAAAFEV